jgi:hypothetical protein
MCGGYIVAAVLAVLLEVVIRLAPERRSQEAQFSRDLAYERTSIATFIEKVIVGSFI